MNFTRFSKKLCCSTLIGLSLCSSAFALDDEDLIGQPPPLPPTMPTP